MHVLDLPSPLKERLYQLQAPEFTEQIRLRAACKTQIGTTPGGTPIFGNAHAYHDFYVQNRLINPVSYSLSKKRYPSDSMVTAEVAEVQLEFMNTDGWFSCTQAGAILRPQDIEQGEVWIYISVGVGNPIDVFKGRIEGRPTEKAGVTIISAVGSLFEPIRKPILYENFGTIAGTSQTILATSQTLVAGAARVPCLGYHFCAYHGIVRFDGSGKKRPSYRQEGTGITLSRIDLGNGLKLGQYRIEFRDARNYTLVCPGNALYSGNVNVDSTGGGITIRASDWIGTNGTGVRIEFAVSWVGVGNPVCMAFNLIEKALANNSGAVPGQLPALRIDTPKWAEMARRFASFAVYVDATNANNDVWDKKAGNEPLSYGDLAQRILDHVCIKMTIDNDGNITLVSPYLDDTDIWPTTTKGEIVAPGITVSGGEAYNNISINYGHEGGQQGYMATLTQDLRINAFADTVDLTVALPYYKHPASQRQAQWVMETVARRSLAKQYTVSTKVSPQHGLTLTPGDVCTLASNTAPFLVQNCEVVKINKVCGGVCDVQYAPIQDAEGTRAAVCAVQLGDASLF